MQFSEKLKAAMQQLGLNQSQVAALTGKSRSSVSQWISGTQVPPTKKQSEIAVAIGIDAGYFDAEAPEVSILNQRDRVVAEIKAKDAARLMRMSTATLESGLKQGVFPWGYAIKTSPQRYRYFINARRFSEIEGVSIPKEMVV